MLGLALVRALEDDWRAVLDAAARRHGWPTSSDVAQLGRAVADLSAAYNDPARARAAMRSAGPARLGFSFARDVPKSAAAVRELVATGQLRVERDARPLRVLDIGAGLGATTWGLVRALAAAGGEGLVEATWVDSDTSALELGKELVRAAPPTLTMPVRLHVHAARAATAALDPLGRFDVVLAGQLLSELDVDMPAADRSAKHAAMIARWLEHNVSEQGSLVLIEPALRDRTRHLHRVRDLLAAEPRVPHVTVFAPCLHAAPCPALVRDTDWCHEDLPVDLPPWLVPVARAAGLRRQGLTFSYLVLRRDGRSLADLLPTHGATPPFGAGAPKETPGDKPGARLRVVSESMRSKGKLEAFVCGELSSGADPARAIVPGRTRAMRLDRDAGAENAAWDEARRGDVLLVTPAPDLEKPRIGAHTVVQLASTRTR
jgi:ribosomal protein RSM22 (predicted rRNA methylase)